MRALGQITPRRFELLLACIACGVEFTGPDLHRQIAPDEPRSTFLRDVHALEVGGWLVGTPPHTDTKRQGRRVTYAVSPQAGVVFHALADAVDAALKAAPGPSGSGTDAPPGS